MKRMVSVLPLIIVVNILLFTTILSSFITAHVVVGVADNNNNNNSQQEQLQQEQEQKSIFIVFHPHFHEYFYPIIQHLLQKQFNYNITIFSTTITHPFHYHLPTNYQSLLNNYKLNYIHCNLQYSTTTTITSINSNNLFYNQYIKENENKFHLKKINNCIKKEMNYISSLNNLILISDNYQLDLFNFVNEYHLSLLVISPNLYELSNLEIPINLQNTLQYNIFNLNLFNKIRNDILMNRNNNTNKENSLQNNLQSVVLDFLLLPKKENSLLDLKYNFIYYFNEISIFGKVLNLFRNLISYFEYLIFYFKNKYLNKYSNIIYLNNLNNLNDKLLSPIIVTDNLNLENKKMERLNQIITKIENNLQKKIIYLNNLNNLENIKTLISLFKEEYFIVIDLNNNILKSSLQKDYNNELSTNMEIISLKQDERIYFLNKLNKNIKINILNGNILNIYESINNEIPFIVIPTSLEEYYYSYSIYKHFQIGTTLTLQNNNLNEIKLYLNNKILNPVIYMKHLLKIKKLKKFILNRNLYYLNLIKHFIDYHLNFDSINFLMENENLKESTEKEDLIILFSLSISVITITLFGIMFCWKCCCKER
ncbi:hypothetical protein ABK040_003579 [Willaertia magna]